MSGVAHLLDATITSALALKPSTVYVLRIENSKTRATWHLRKCFSEFCELREKVVALIDGTSVTSSTTCCSASTSSNASTSGSFDSHSSSGSELSCNSSSTESSITKTTSGCDRFPYLYKQFPRRQLFGSRSKRVIEQRTHALNAFLRQLLFFVREVKQQNQIAVYFSVMNFVEPFFECATHAFNVSSNNYITVTPTTPFNFNTFSLNSPSTLARTQAAAAAAARAAVTAPLSFHRHHPQSPFTYNDDGHSSEDEDEDESDRESAVAVGPADVASNKSNNNFNFARRFYQEYGQTAMTANRGSDSDSDSDDEETKLVLGLKKTVSCIAHRELREMKMHFSGSHYAPMQSIDATTTTASSGRTIGGGTSASDAWAARIEIAGFSPATAGRANNNSNSNAQVQNSSKLTVDANHVRHHPNHSSNKKTHNAETSPVQPQQQQSKQQLSHKYGHAEQKMRETQPASIVYASSSKAHQQPSGSSSKAMLFKQKQFHASAATTGSRRVQREERPEWA